MKKFLNSPWTIAIGAASFSFLLSVGYDLFKGNKLFTTINTLFIYIRNILDFCLNYKLKAWWVLLGFLALLIIRLLILKAKKYKEPVMPDLLSKYRQDHFRQWDWTWDWEWNYLEQKWYISNLQAHCPKCNTVMLSGMDEELFQCPRCRYKVEFDDHEKSYEIEAIIIDNLNRNQKSGGQV